MTNISVFRKVSSLVALATLACADITQAADKIRYEELPNRLAPFGRVLAYRGFHVTTADGKQHNGRRLMLEPGYVRVFHLNSFEDLPAGQVSRIEISQAGRFMHHIGESAIIPVMAGALLCEDPGVGCVAGFIGVTALFSPIWAYTAVTAPFFLAADGVSLFLPSKVYEIRH